ncbi:hypothetical protein SLEP1_g36384 [Rubroshorea leprosula]|uniref:Uncharacterized protein n=1 Tax=Rubroshorea leprosula TaxID=152421 RepID=A0AAV5KRB9_9ROSI|nr:hypothetical protein SLEP1_g36384 [Rubroshorea leprosula]
MPANGGKSKSKSVRKPLRELSNNGNRNGGGKFSKPENLKKKNSEKEKENDESLDRLLLVQSDLSSLLRQIDELVVQAFKLKGTDKQGGKEIEVFTNFLSEMLSSLKPWVPRFEKVILGPAEPEDQPVQGLASVSVGFVKEDESFEVASPEQTKCESLISPSPLVSWRAECNVERGRQLFLLTPLPMSKTLSSKRQDHKPLDSILAGMAEKGKTVTCELDSLPMFPEGDHSMLIMTPCLKMSPPKSCVLLEPICESSHGGGDDRVRKSTPFPFGVGLKNFSASSESSDGEALDDLTVKYPELLGIRQTYKSRIEREELDASPKWLFSPPKSCVLLEPPDEKSLSNIAMDHHLSIPFAADPKTDFPSSKADNPKDAFPKTVMSNQGYISNSLLHIESTPLWKEPESTIRTGKRPGESTLKKELWTRFEAASTYGLRHTASAFPRTVQKGFLDMLDEVSCDEETPISDGLR